MTLSRVLSDGSVIIDGVRWVRFTQRGSTRADCCACGIGLYKGLSYFKPTDVTQSVRKIDRICAHCVSDLTDTLAAQSPTQ